MTKTIEDLKVGIIAVTPEGAAMAFKQLAGLSYDKYGKYRSPSLVMSARPLIRHVETLTSQDEWVGLLQDTINELVAAGADILWMPANSSHVAWDKLDMHGKRAVNMVNAAVDHIARDRGKPLLLGTTTSISEKLYLKDKAAITRAVAPNPKDQVRINDIIIKELVLGEISKTSRTYIKRLASRYAKSHGTDSLFFACTELPCFFTGKDFKLPIMDSLTIGARAVLHELNALLKPAKTRQSA